MAQLEQQPADTEELGRVVVAEEEAVSPTTPWYVTLRPWLFCLLFLLIAEGITRYVFDRTLILHHERFDNFPNAAAEDAFVREMKRDKAFKVVMIGDSVMVGSTRIHKDQTIPCYIEKTLHQTMPDRQIHVWNFSIAGARSTDQYCLLLKALEAHPDLVVITGNYMTFAIKGGIKALPLSNPWLARNLPEVPEPIRPLLEPRKRRSDAASGLHLWYDAWTKQTDSIEETLSNFFEKNIRLIGLRQAINGLVFGVQPRDPIDSPNPAIMAANTIGKTLKKVRPESWRESGKKPGLYKQFYEETIRPDNLNGAFYRYILDTLHKNNIPSFTYFTPQNPGFIDRYMDRSQYLAGRQVMSRFLADPAIANRDFSDLVPTELFLDNDHMLPKGNEMLANAVAAEIEPLIEAHIGSRPER